MACGLEHEGDGAFHGRPGPWWVDAVEAASRYLPDFCLTLPGYNHGGYGRRVLHTGVEPWVEPDPEATNRFLDVMAFASDADRANAVAAALTVLLRDHRPGGKPCLVVTSAKSHGGKETVVSFAACASRQVSVSYEAADWALQKAFVAAVRHDPGVGLVDVENARLDRDRSETRTASLGRSLTDPEPPLFSPGTGGPARGPDDLDVSVTTNEGAVSVDPLIRALSVHLDPVGEVADKAASAATASQARDPGWLQALRRGVGRLLHVETAEARTACAYAPSARQTGEAGMEAEGGRERPASTR